MIAAVVVVAAAAVVRWVSMNMVEGIYKATRKPKYCDYDPIFVPMILVRNKSEQKPEQRRLESKQEEGSKQ